MSHTGMTLCCELGDLNWECLTEFPVRLAKHGLPADTFSADLDSYPFSVTFNSITDTVRHVREKGRPYAYYLTFGVSKAPSSSLTVHRLTNIYKQEMLRLQAKGFANEECLRELAAFLGLKPGELTYEECRDRTAFVAHRFDARGMDLADRLARFLALLGFSVKTGRAFSPRSVAQKVKERMDGQSLVFVIVTPGADDTWLIQESVLQHDKKPVFILRDQASDLKLGILADHEFIPFHQDHFEAVYQPILEGLKELGFLKFEE